jgi:hypothetical protein
VRDQGKIMRRYAVYAACTVATTENELYTAAKIRTKWLPPPFSLPFPFSHLPSFVHRPCLPSLHLTSLGFPLPPPHFPTYCSPLLHLPTAPSTSPPHCPLHLTSPLPPPPHCPLHLTSPLLPPHLPTAPTSPPHCSHLPPTYTENDGPPGQSASSK